MMEFESIIIWIIAPLILSFIVTFSAVSYANKLGFVAQPDPTVLNHVKSIPLLGGLGILSGIIPSLIFISPEHINLVAFIGGLVIVAGLGAFKDRIGNSVSSFFQLTVQGIVIALLIKSGLHLTPTGVTEIDYAASFIVGLWVLNSINFLDVMDGLAGGICLIIFIGLSFVMLIVGQTAWLSMAIAASASLAGFLFFNRYPARIFMGDIGSFGLGYLLAAMLFFLSKIERLDVGLALYAIPLLEVISSSAMRLFGGRSPLIGDGTHVSLILLRRGYTVHFIVRLFYLSTTFFVLAGLMLSIGLFCIKVRNAP